MPSTLLNFSHTEKPRQIQANIMAYMRLFIGLPGTVAAVDGENLFWFISDQPAPGRQILRARFTDDPDAQIDALFEQLSQHTDEIDWMIFPGDQPADLSQRLEARGMPAGRGGNWLWADLQTLGAAPSMPDGFRIERVANDEQMAEWIQISEAGFGELYPHFYAAYARHGYGADAFSLHYIGYLGDTPVTSSTLLDAGGTAGIYDVSTPPDLRGQGFGSAITHFMMREMLSRGYTDTWIWASDIGRKVYQKIGYVDADFGMREHTWRKGL